MEKSLDKWTNGQTNGQTDRWMDGQMDRGMDGWMTLESVTVIEQAG